MNIPSKVAPVLLDVPASWRGELQLQLASEENVLAWLEVDLDARLYFANSLLVLTGERLLWCEPDTQNAWHSLSLHDTHRMELSDHAGVGHLRLLDSQQQLADWRFTLGRQLQASALLTRFNQRMAGHSEGVAQAWCEVCHAPLGSTDAHCRSCELAQEETPASTWSLFRLWRFAKPYQGQLFLGFCLTLASTAATLVPPYLTMPLMDDVLIPFQNGQQIDTSLVTMYLGGLLGAALFAWGLGWFKTYVLALASERIGADLRSTAYEHLLKLSLEYFGGRRTGDLMTRIGSETDRLCVFLSLHLLDFATDVLMILMTAIILFSIDPWLACATLLPLPFIAWLIHMVRDRLRTGFEKIDRVWSELTNVLADTIPGIRVVKAFAQEQREAQRFQEANKHNLAVNDRINFLWSLFSPTVTLVTEIGLLVVWAFGIWQVAHHQVTVGVLTAFLAYSTRFYARLDAMSRIVSHTQKAVAGTKRIFEILDHVSSVPEPVNPVALPEVVGRIHISNAGFRYGNRAVIKDLTLDIAPGEMIGLVGQSGSGKSTLVDVLLGLLAPASGAVLVDGTNVQNRIRWWQDQIGYVPQSIFLTDDTLRRNVAFGLPKSAIDDAAVDAAIRAAQLEEFVKTLPLGLETVVGERGVRLSGGQRQRIGIARALYHNPDVLVLDEATSSLDTETEHGVMQAVQALQGKKTVIIVAHRLSTVEYCDRLYRLESSRIVDEGTFEEVMNRA